ncbi:HNH endonuclease [Rhizobium sp. T136]|uniref:HNH endonuclease n=1 Tax=Rhizobium sp. T136 TaxID=555319 RepID=UPI001E61C454|nr:HNH endonuclease signature motif containing protein [Rhizobium sp. T136]UFS83160.1 HNH endonuclease [Rhizobium sp. T136]
MPRKHFSRTDRVRIFDLSGGRCHICCQKIQVGEAWDIEHLVPWELTRDDSDSNIRPAHKTCHKVKTADDVSAIRKADRIRAKHIGAWPQSRAKIKSAGFRKTRSM